MIQLFIEDYCHNCPDFEPDIDKNKLRFTDDDTDWMIELNIPFDPCPICETNIRCKHRKRCKSMMRHLEKELKKENDNVS